jgi:hypothetical protein
MELDFRKEPEFIGSLALELHAVTVAGTTAFVIRANIEVSPKIEQHDH